MTMSEIAENMWTPLDRPRMTVAELERELVLWRERPYTDIEICGGVNSSNC